MPEHRPTDNSPRHPWRTPLLLTEFIALAVLVGSMALLGNIANDGTRLNTAWLAIPALASLLVFVSFIGLMYLRWVAAAQANRETRHKVVFALLTLTLLGVWVFGIARTWLSIG
ncbi:hypothetical protein [Marinobacter caseinilyticus]|uniref:hypothetical protein n=1 Tax=Marinobacter caseinilyticus TaxID=2692195 RepID=UPI00140DED11|nr:hypothetical protein [Marinobacter caseinilyticus]